MYSIGHAAIMWDGTAWSITVPGRAFCSRMNTFQAALASAIELTLWALA